MESRTEILRRELRKRAITRKFLSLQCGIPYNTVRGYLAGKVIPESKLRVICLTFRIPLSLFALEEPYNQHSEAGGSDEL